MWLLPKLAIGVRTNAEMESRDCYRYGVLLSLVFDDVWMDLKRRFQKDLYETGKLDSSLSMEVEINHRFYF